MNPRIEQLQPYPFERLQKLLDGITPADKPAISLSIGEPKHTPPAHVLNCLQQHLDKIAVYPKTAGTDALKGTIRNWLEQRFNLPQDSLGLNQILPLNGTREGLFSFIQATANPQKTGANIIMPNPFYQIYEGASILAGVAPYFLNSEKTHNDLAEVFALEQENPEVLENCQILIICTPGNPTGAVITEEKLQQLIRLADKYNFIIVSDECYSEIYFDEQNPPPGLLQAAANMGNTGYKNCVVFHSLSKRSNLPGLRSGFVAGDKNVISTFLKYRTYHGSAMAEPVQKASIAAWSDESHVVANRKLYQQKFKQVLAVLKPVMDVTAPDASFYLWPKLTISDTEFCQKLYQQQNVLVLPGQFLSRQAHGINPGENRVRMALVASPEQCLEAAMRIKQFVLDNNLWAPHYLVLKTATR